MTGRRWTWLIAALLCGAALVGVRAARTVDGTGYRTFTLWSEGFREPSAVAVLSDGAVAVADYSADEVAVLEPDGTVRWRVGGLDHPSGLDGDERGVWVADAAQHRLVLLASEDGRTLHEVPTDPSLHPTDVAVGLDGALWVSATPEDRLLLIAADGTVLLDLLSAAGEALRAPRGLAADGAGGVFVAEALGGRVLHLGPDGAVLATVGEWGLGEGQFVKPKDVTLAADGSLFVLDTHQGVLQVLTEEGGYGGLVVDANGPLVFEHPLGVAVHEDRVYVADAGANVVRVLTAGGSAWNAGRFPSPTTLFRRVSIRDDDPSPLCRQCHDGTRRLTAGNWDPGANNHPRDIGPPDSVPADFALTSEGTLKCTACHLVHVPEEQAQHAAVVDIGIVDPTAPHTVKAAGFCLECHADYLDTSPALHRTSHPVGLEPPEGADVAALERAGSRFTDGEVTCRACHRPHGAVHDDLLVLSAQEGALCLNCHGDHGRAESHHPVQIAMAEDARATVEELGGVVSPDGTLTCLSCHDPHQSTAGTLLRARGGAAAACRACHDEQAATLPRGGHAPVGCQGCHGMHEPPSLPRGEDLPGSQVCADCHTTPGAAPWFRLADSHPVAVDDPDGPTGCETCHETHGADARLLTTDTVGDLCVDCHEEQAAVTGTDHDAATVGVVGSTDTCLSCHDVHGTSEDFLVADVREGVNPASGRCLRCHDGSTTATAPEFVDHPPGLLLTVAGLPFRYQGPVPYFGPNGRPSSNREAGEITCSTCHDPHRWKHDADLHPGAADGSEQTSFLRNPDDVANFCTVCHGVDGLLYFRYFHTDRVRKGGTP